MKITSDTKNEEVKERMLNTLNFMSEKEYIDQFYDPKFSAYDFMILFCSLYALQDNYVFNKSTLLDFIKICKENGNYNDLLEEINFKSNGIYEYSNDINEAISKLKLGNIIYTISPEQDDSIYIHKEIPAVDIIKQRIDYFEMMYMFVSAYNSYEKMNQDKKGSFEYFLNKLTYGFFDYHK